MMWALITSAVYEHSRASHSRKTETLMETMIIREAKWVLPDRNYRRGRCLGSFTIASACLLVSS